MQMLPSETNGTPSIAPTGSLKGSHNLACAAMLRDTGVPDGKTDNDIETTTAQECITINGVNNYPCTADAETEFHSLISDVNIMEGMLEPIPEERPASSLGKFEHSSMEYASSRNYDSVSSLSPNYGQFSNLSHSPLPLADVQNYLAPQSAPLIQDIETTDAAQDWDMTGTNAIAEVLTDATSSTGAEPYMQQALAPLSAPTHEVSPTALLLMTESKHITIELSEGDAVRIEKLAELFECARSYQDAYQLRRLLLLYAPRQTNMKDPASNRTLLNAIKVTPDEARRRLGALRPKMLMMRNGVDLQSRLFDVLGWCVITLAEDGFWEMLLRVKSDLWMQAPDEAHLREVESTLLFIYLWSQQPSHSGRHNLISDSVDSRSSCVPAFAHAWGISVAEVLSVVANYIITTLGPYELSEQLTLARRVLTAATFRYETVERNRECQDMLAIFRDARVAIHHQSASPSNTEDYAALVRTAVRDIVERRFNLELEIPAPRGQRLQNRLSQASMRPSYSPTMPLLNELQSFKLTAQRASQIWVKIKNSQQ